MRWNSPTRRAFLFLVVLFWGTGLNFGQALRVMTIEFPPYEYFEGGQAKGIAVDIIKEAFKRMGREIHISVVPFTRGLESLQTGTADVMFTYYKVPGRETFSDYSTEPLVDQTVSLFVTADSTVTFDGDLTKLSDRSFGLVNFSYGSNFDNFKKTLKKVDVSMDSEMNVDKLANRRFDIMPSDQWVASFYFRQFQSGGSTPSDAKFKELQPPVETFSAFVGFSKTNRLTALRDGLDATLRGMKKDGSYERILASWAKELGK